MPEEYCHHQHQPRARQVANRCMPRRTEAQLKLAIAAEHTRPEWYPGRPEPEWQQACATCRPLGPTPRRAGRRWNLGAQISLTPSCLGLLVLVSPCSRVCCRRVRLAHDFSLITLHHSRWTPPQRQTCEQPEAGPADPAPPNSTRPPNLPSVRDHRDAHVLQRGRFIACVTPPIFFM